MSEDQPTTAQRNARLNFERLQANLSTRLVAKEAGLLEKFSRHRGNPLRKLADLYHFMDDIYGAVQRFTPCKKGCNHCCYYEISVTELEAEYIESTTGMKRLSSLQSPVSNTPCPFLQQGRCSIYNSRPFVCRRHVSLCNTSYWCHPDRCETVELSMLSFSEVDKAFSLILQDSGLGAYVDIRQLFSVRWKSNPI